MKKIIGLALFAILVVSAIAAASAFAEPNWLVDGLEAAAGTKVEAKGALTLTDLKTLIGEASVRCEGIFEGRVGPKGEGSVTEVLNTSGVLIGEKLTGTHLVCPAVKGCEGNGEVWFTGLPWKTQMTLSGTAILDVATASTIGYEIVCTAFGIKQSDECTQAELSSTVENMLEGEANDLLEIFNEEDSSTCTLSKEKSDDIKGEELISDAEGLTLIVAGDGVTE